MNYGLHLSASGALVAMHRMDVLANNLANVGTVGFKPELAAARQRDVARVEDHLPFLPSSTLLERLGGGVMSGPNRIAFEQGPLQRTDAPLDLAVQGNGFFVVRDEADPSGDRFRLTRDGRFTLDPSGRLISATSGLAVMDVNNRPIVLADRSQVQVGVDGTVRQNGTAVAQIRLAEVPDTSRLAKVGRGLFRGPAEAFIKQANDNGGNGGEIRQGFVEGSSVDPVGTMLAVTEAGRAAEASLGLISTQDRLMDRAINSLGRIG